MSKNFDKLTKFSKKFDMGADGVEEDVVSLLKEKFPKYYKAAKKDLMAANGGDEDENPSPDSIYAYIPESEDDKFFSSVEKLFKEKFSDEIF